MQQSLLSQRRIEKLQKISDSLGNLYVEETNMDITTKTFLEQVLLIWSRFNAINMKLQYF